MDTFHTKFIAGFQRYRSKHWDSLGRGLHTLGISANMLTFFSLLSGLLAVYWLFSNYSLFVLFAVLHLLFDALDGVVARVSGTASSPFGKYFDQGSDSIVTILAVLKVGWYLQDLYAYLIAGLFFLAIIIYFLSRCQAPIIFMRTVAMLVLMIATYPLFPFQQELLTVGYLVAGSVTVYSLARQLQFGITRFQ